MNDLPYQSRQTYHLVMQTASNSLQRITKSRSPRNPNRKMEHETIRYKERLRALKILPLSMYIELHGTLFLHSVMDGKYNVKDESIPVSMRNSATRRSSDFELSENCLHKTDERFGTRAPKLFNVLHYQFRDNPTKKKLTEHYFKNSCNQ